MVSILMMLDINDSYDNTTDAQQINGCEFITEMTTIVDFPTISFQSNSKKTLKTSSHEGIFLGLYCLFSDIGLV